MAAWGIGHCNQRLEYSGMDVSPKISFDPLIEGKDFAATRNSVITKYQATDIVIKYSIPSFEVVDILPLNKLVVTIKHGRKHSKTEGFCSS